MLQEMQKQVERLLSVFGEPMRRWAGSVVLAIAVGIAFFLVARLSLTLLTEPDRVAVFWPAAGVAAGVLIAFGPGARLPVAVGTIVASMSLYPYRPNFPAIIFPLCNAGEAMLVAGLIDHCFGSAFSLGRLSNVLGLLVVAMIGSAVAAIGGTVGFVLADNSTVPVLTIWYHWFTSNTLGIVTFGPLLIGLVSAARDPRHVAKSSKALWLLWR
jgi:integral membrane sensor domain MASE1